LLIVFIPRLVISVYTTNTGLITDTVPALYVIMVALSVFSFASILFNAVSGTARTEVALLIETVTIFLYLIFTYILGVELQLPVHYVWLSEIVYFILMGGMSFLYLRSGYWKKKI
jgi:Na+-driven multidrug efflux pump